MYVTGISYRQGVRAVARIQYEASWGKAKAEYISIFWWKSSSMRCNNGLHAPIVQGNQTGIQTQSMWTWGTKRWTNDNCPAIIGKAGFFPVVWILVDCVCSVWKCCHSFIWISIYDWGTSLRSAGKTEICATFWVCGSSHLQGNHYFLCIYTMFGGSDMLCRVVAKRHACCVLINRDHQSHQSLATDCWRHSMQALLTSA